MSTAHPVALLTLAMLLVACRDEPPGTSGSPAPPVTYKLRHEFHKGRVLRYESKTLERARVEVGIEMRTRWTVTEVRDDGAGEMAVGIERYEQRVFPAVELPAEVKLLNKELAGARFRILVEPDGTVEHLGQDKVSALSEFSLEAIRTSLASHVLKLPDSPVRSGQRWTVETSPSADAGPGGVTTTSRWRVLSIRPEGGRSLAELVCLSTMEPGRLEVEGQPLRNQTEFHYSYLWNVTGGYLEGLTSRGSTKLWELDGANDGGTGKALPRTSYEAELRLLPGSQRQ